MTIKYRLIDPDTLSNTFEIDGNSILYFNDNTNGTFHDTYEIVKKTKTASKCYLIEHTKIWYQLIYKDLLVYQYSFNGTLVRRIEQIDKLSDEQIRDLIKVGVHSGTPSTDISLNPIYDIWEKNLLTALENGSVSVDSIKRVIYGTNNSHNQQYLGGRWLVGFLNGFTNKYPQYMSLIDIQNV